MRRFRCVGCGAEVEWAPASGPLPSRCPTCRPAHKRQSQNAGNRARRSRGHYARFKLTPAKYDRLALAQGGECVGCKRPLDEVERHIDHDHECCTGGKTTCGVCVRGVLCRACNTALGLAADDPERLRRLANYVEYFNWETATRKARA